MEKLFELFKNHEGKNWTLFLIILGLVHSVWWFGTFDFIKEFGTQNPYFIFLEILFIASSITRILIAIDIFYIIETCPGISDCITLLWKKRRDEWRRWDIELYELGEFGINDTTSYEFSQILYDIITIQPFFVYESYDPDTQQQITKFIDKFKKNDKLPYHIEYWIKLEIKKCRKAIAKENAKKSFLDKTIIIGKKIGKYILSYVQKH